MSIEQTDGALGEAVEAGLGWVRFKAGGAAVGQAADALLRARGDWQVRTVYGMRVREDEHDDWWYLDVSDIDAPLTDKDVVDRMAARWRRRGWQAEPVAHDEVVLRTVERVLAPQEAGS